MLGSKSSREWSRFLDAESVHRSAGGIYGQLRAGRGDGRSAEQQQLADE